MKGLRLAVALGLFLASAAAFAEEQGAVDSLFEDPADDSVVDADAEPAKGLLDEVAGSEPLFFSGSLSASVGIVGGWTRVPAGLEGLGTPDLSGYFEFSNRLNAKARLDRSFAVSGTFLTECPDFSVAVEELFFDYTLAERIFFRVGKQKNAWGNGRIFTFTDLITEDGGLGLTVKAYAPIGGGGLTVALLERSAFHPATDYPGLSTLAYLGKADFRIGPVEVQTSGRYREAEGFRATAALKTSTLGFELFHESLIASPDLKALAYSAVSGFYRECRDIGLKVYGEHAYKDGSEAGAGHRAALAAVMDLFSRPGFRARAGFSWEHAFADSSGEAIPAILLEPAPYLSLKLGMPLLYGADGSYYVTESEDPTKRRVSFAVAATITASY